MLRPDFDISYLTTDMDVVARIVPGEKLFSLTSRSIVVPEGWMALAGGRQRDPVVVRAGHRYEDDDTTSVLFVRTTAIECTEKVSSVRSADGFECEGLIRIFVRILDDPADLSAFRKTVFGTADIVSMEMFTQYLRWQLRGVLESLASQSTADRLLSNSDVADIEQLVRDKLGTACLAGGLRIESPIVVRFESSAYREHCRSQAAAAVQRRHASTRVQIQEALAAAQQQRLTHLVSMLKTLQEADDRQPDLKMADLLRAFNENDRAELYGALWHLCSQADTTEFIAVVSGMELLLFRPKQFNQVAHRYELPGDVGALRSVSVDARSGEARLLLLGAATGVLLVEPQTGKTKRHLAFSVSDGQPVRGGFNAVAMSDHTVFATHSQLGLVSWSMDAVDRAAGRRLHGDRMKDTTTIRGVQVGDDYLFLAVDEVAWALPLRDIESSEPVRYVGSTSVVSCLKVSHGLVYAGNIEGQILEWRIGDPTSAQIVRGRTGRPVESIDIIQAGGVDHLVVADRERALLAIVSGDHYVRRYESPSHIVRRAAAAGDVLAAMNDSREQLLVWAPDQPASPIGTVVIPHLTGNSIQDLCLVPSM